MMRYYESNNIVNDMAVIIDKTVEENKGIDLAHNFEFIREHLAEGNRNFIWLARSGGTECFAEDEVFLIDAPNHQQANYYLNHDFTVNAYLLTVEDTTGAMQGRIYAADVQLLADMVAQKSIPTGEIEVETDNGQSYRRDFQTYSKHRADVILSLMEQYGFDEYKIKYRPVKEDSDKLAVVLSEMEGLRQAAEKSALENLIA